MARTLAPICLILALLVVGCCRGSESTLPQPCQQSFQDVLVWPDVTSQPSFETLQLALSPQVVEAGERFLNGCTDPNLPISDQTQRFEELEQLARMISPDASSSCCTVYTPTLQLEDLNADGTDELVLHTQMLRCNGAGGISTVYCFNDETETWHGTLIWPSPYNDYARFGSPNIVEPLVRTLLVQDSTEREFVLVAGVYGGADHMGKLLTVWEWKDKALEVLFEIGLSSWCEYAEWDKWEITDEGHILVHAAQATARCEAREATLYVWENDRFVSKTP